ncbi:hypothetical protein AZE99_14130 [Sphingorhabdus sp. M41]|nr:hypothetical protein AZE99_14130 [Sphingorhabdus sp. M41]
MNDGKLTPSTDLNLFGSTAQEKTEMSAGLGRGIPDLRDSIAQKKTRHNRTGYSFWIYGAD